MIAMRYGCIPIARATGGLRDTIFDFKKSNRSTGFLFSDPTSEALTTAIRRALSAYNDQSAWHALQKRGMSHDFSWEHSADQYLELYDILVSARVNNENNFT
jgi:starch synthase